jgi:hypothetical protein
MKTMDADKVICDHESCPIRGHGPTLLAQQTSSSFNCRTSQDRNKAALDDFWSIYRGPNMWTDEVFGHGNDALFWPTMGEGSGDMSQLTNMI